MNVPSGQASRGGMPARAVPSASSSSRRGSFPSPNRAALRAFAEAPRPGRAVALERRRRRVPERERAHASVTCGVWDSALLGNVRRRKAESGRTKRKRQKGRKGRHVPGVGFNHSRNGGLNLTFLHVFPGGKIWYAQSVHRGRLWRSMGEHPWTRSRERLREFRSAGSSLVAPKNRHQPKTRSDRVSRATPLQHATMAAIVAPVAVLAPRVTAPKARAARTLRATTFNGVKVAQPKVRAARRSRCRGKT